MTSKLIVINDFSNIINLNLEGKNLAKRADHETIDNRISKLVNNVILHIKKERNNSDDKLIYKLIDKLDVINDQFLKAGKTPTFSSSIIALKSILKLNNISQHPFVSDLYNLTKTNLPETGQNKIARNLYEFQEQILLPAIQSAKNSEEIKILEEIIEQCESLSKKLSSIDKVGVLKDTRKKIKTLYKIKIIQTDLIYNNLISYEKGNLGDLSQKTRREKIANNLSIFISKIIKFSSEITQEDKLSIYKSIWNINEEYNEHRDKSITHILTDLHKSLDIPLLKEKSIAIAQRSTKFENLRTKFDQIPKDEPLPLTAKKTNIKKSQSEQEILEEISQRIQKNISNLSLLNQNLKDTIKTIKSDIQKLKNISLCNKKDYTQLENILDLINNPSTLKISSEESEFLKLLIDRSKLAGKKEQILSSYFDLEKTSIENTQLLIIQTLENSKSIDEILKSVEHVKNRLRDKAIKDRFDRFVEQNPSLKRFNLSPYFPVIINTFEDFTKKAAMELNDKWEQLTKLYDKQTKNQFSKLLKNYSYLDPTKHFSPYVEIAQEEFFKSLNLQSPFSNSNLNSRLQQTVDNLKGVIGKQFENNYLDIFSEKHLWLAANREKIITPFNQGDDHDKNLGEGVCYANSLYRCSLLMKDPNLAKIQMGSNEKTRFAQKKYESQHDLASLGKTTYNTVCIELAKAFGLKRYHEYDLSFSNHKDSYQHLADEIENYAKSGHTQLVLVLRGPKEGHAINMQLQYKNGTFKMMDDNIGLVQYKSIDEFKREIKSYFKTFYPNYNQYCFEIFSNFS